MKITLKTGYKFFYITAITAILSDFSMAILSKVFKMSDSLAYIILDLIYDVFGFAALLAMGFCFWYAVEYIKNLEEKEEKDE